MVVITPQLWVMAGGGVVVDLMLLGLHRGSDRQHCCGN